MELVVLAGLACGVIAAMIARNKGNSPFGGFIAGLLFGPLGILFEAVHSVSAKRQAVVETKSRAGMQKCDQCAEWVQADAKVCRYCHAALTAP